VSSILIIDDNHGVCSSLEMLFSLYDLPTLSAQSPEAGLALLDSQDIGLVIQDMNFTEDTTSGQEGEALFKKIRLADPDMPIVLLTAWTQLETAVELVKLGAADYMAKPWDDDKLVVVVRNLLALRDVQSELAEQREQADMQRQNLDQFDLCGTVFHSNSMAQVLMLATQVADSNLPVLITGPNGCGKEKIAEIIHKNSKRQGEMVRTNAGAIPADLIESELFGSSSGAFTGAKDRQGRFSKAHSGSLFLDEIGNLPLQGQVKLLRVLQTGEFEALGSSETQSVDVRLICATNSNLVAEIAAGNFREDLYYRINVVEIKVPPLNQRPADILPLAHYFLKPEFSLSTQAEQTLMDHHWPGNVRELENCMQRAQLLCQQGVIEVDHLGIQRLSSEVIKGARVLTEQDITTTLLRYNGVVSRAAKSLGLSRQAFYRRMEAYGLKD
jgi:DNA-binding NtrC family response regulator